MILNVDPQLSQWDVGRSVSVSDSNATHIHFANQGDSKAVIIEITEGSAKIPDYLLQTGKTVIAYAVLDGVTLESKSFPVCKRERPENYVYEEDQRNYIYELIQSTEGAADRANDAADRANEAADRMNDHIVDNNNPHGVTAEQIGAVGAEEYNIFVHDVINHITSVEADLTTHCGRKDNPHEVTCGQIGAVTQEEFEEVLSNLENTGGGSGQFAPHLIDKNNPHEVTAEQVGAVKEEELAGKVETIIEDDYDAGGPIWGTISSVVQDSAAHFAEQQLATTLIDRRLVGHDSNADRLTYEIEQDNYVQVTPAQVGAAPAGFGCSEQSAKATNWNNHYRNGFYKEVANSPDGANLWYGISCVSSYGEVTNIAFNPNTTNGSTMAIRHHKGTTPYPWEYVNPPMLEGVEYRTIERHNGKPVYAKLVNGGLLTNNTSKFVTLVGGSVDVISVSGYLTRTGENGYFPLPRYNTNGNISAFLYAAYYSANDSSTVANIISKEDMTNYTVFLKVKYTKNNA